MAQSVDPMLAAAQSSAMAAWAGDVFTLAAAIAATVVAWRLGRAESRLAEQAHKTKNLRAALMGEAIYDQVRVLGDNVKYRYVDKTAATAKYQELLQQSEIFKAMEVEDQTLVEVGSTMPTMFYIVTSLIDRAFDHPDRLDEIDSFVRVIQSDCEQGKRQCQEVRFRSLKEKVRPLKVEIIDYSQREK
jgi:hypothetical protein